jgi:hypothetical protein
MCPACVAAESRAESPDFGRVLLHQQHRRVLATRHLARTALATLLPGYGLLASRRLVRPLLLLVTLAALAGPWLGLSAPFSFEPRLARPETEGPLPWQLGAWIALHALSIVTYLALVARDRAREAALHTPVRSRAVQSTRRVDAAAA